MNPECDSIEGDFQVVPKRGVALAQGAEKPPSSAPSQLRDSDEPAFGPSPTANRSAWSAADLLTADEAAAELKVKRRWLYRHVKTLPFARKLSRKVLRFSRIGIHRWLATKRP